MAKEKDIQGAASKLACRRWLSLSEAANYLGVGTKFLTSRCTQREVTFVRLGQAGRTRSGSYRFKAQWLDEYLERLTTYARTPLPKRPRPRPLVTGEVFIDPRDCGNPFEE